jgi:hypothetical protein
VQGGPGGSLVGIGWRRQRRRRSVGPDGDADRGRPVDGGACARCRGRGGKAKGAGNACGNGETVKLKLKRKPRGRANHTSSLLDRAREDLHIVYGDFSVLFITSPSPRCGTRPIAPSEAIVVNRPVKYDVIRTRAERVNDANGTPHSSAGGHAQLRQRSAPLSVVLVGVSVVPAGRHSTAAREGRHLFLP